MAGGTTHAIPELDARALRKFGITTGVIVAVLFGLLLPWLFGAAMPWWPWVLCGVLLAWGTLAPRSLRFVHRAWMRFGLLMSRVMTPLILGLAFALVVTPFAVGRALLGRDSMARRIDPKVDSYRIRSNEAPVKNMEKPY